MNLTHRPTTPLRRSISALLLSSALYSLAGCTFTGTLLELPQPLRGALPPDANDTLPAVDAPKSRSTQFSAPPAAPGTDWGATNARPGAHETASLTVNLEEVTIPVFVNEVYGNLLKQSFQIDAAVSAKKETLTLRLTEAQTPGQLRLVADQILSDHGVSVIKRGEVLRFAVGSETATGGQIPVTIQGKQLPPDIADDARVSQWIPLQTVRNAQVAGWLRSAFENQPISVEEDMERNAVILKGTAALVRQAAETLALLDQPFMRGRHSLRIDPAYWNAEDLAKRLEEIMQSEGYAASQKPGGSSSLLILPLKEVNSVIAFAGDQSVLKHIHQWVEQLDKPRQPLSQEGIFYYLAQNTSAINLMQTLAPLLANLLGQNDLAAAAQINTSTPGSVNNLSMNSPGFGQSISGGNFAGGGSGGGFSNSFGNSGFGSRQSNNRNISFTGMRNLSVDTGRNALIFSGTGAQWSKVRPVLEAMDKPAKLALIEVTVAEVTLTDKRETGVEWLLKNVHMGGLAGDIMSGGTFPVAKSGLNALFGSQNGTKFMLNFLGTNSRVNILSNPRIMVRNGEQASIDVGTEVPVLTSQGTNLLNGSSSGFIQQYQYRKTGVLLNVIPTIHAGRRVDLDIEQEVSEAQENTTSNAPTPAIFNRKIATSLSLKDGSSILLGGLVSSSRTEGNNGIPFLKDIPWLGYLFGTEKNNGNRTEMVVLITPYVVADAAEAESITDAFRKTLNVEQPSRLDNHVIPEEAPPPVEIETTPWSSGANHES